MISRRVVFSARSGMVCLLLAPIGIAMLIPTLASAQARAGGEERAAVLAVVRRLFDGMRAGDSAAVRAQFHPRAILWSAVVRNGAPEVRFDSVDVFVRAVGAPHQEAWDERTSNETVHIDGTLATVWTDYAFYAGARFSHCGVDTFQLARTQAGWKIVALADTRRRDGCSEGSAKG